MATLITTPSANSTFSGSQESPTSRAQSPGKTPYDMSHFGKKAKEGKKLLN
jgi:hypothetical protein